MTTIVKDPSILPVTPAATNPPGLVSQLPGLGPASVTKLPSLNCSVTSKVPSALGVVLTRKNRSNVSLAQKFPHVPESGDVLSNGP